MLRKHACGRQLRYLHQEFQSIKTDLERVAPVNLESIKHSIATMHPTCLVKSFKTDLLVQNFSIKEVLKMAVEPVEGLLVAYADLSPDTYNPRVFQLGTSNVKLLTCPGLRFPLGPYAIETIQTPPRRAPVTPASESQLYRELSRSRDGGTTLLVMNRYSRSR